MLDRFVSWSRFALTTTTWISAGLFGLYILAHYAGAWSDGQPQRWNDVLPGLYEPGRESATVGIGAHFVAGGIILALGFIQFIDGIRARVPAVHRWLGRFYVAAAFTAGVGGTAFIFLHGTIGGPVMDVGFGLYGVLTTLCAVQTYRHARARRLELHRAWALRLFALAIGSWLYRMDYGFWMLLANGAGHEQDFRGPFDQVMAFFFYIPNLVVVELMLRSGRGGASLGGKLAATGAFVAATGLLLLGTYYFTKFYWGPAILGRFAGSEA